MSGDFSEEDVHKYLFAVGLPKVIADTPELETQPASPGYGMSLWEVIKARTIAKLSRLHLLLRSSELAGSKVKLPITSTRRMELDLVGYHAEGVFVLELKTERSAERNAFSEMLAYTNYFGGMFPMTGRHDISNVLIANVDATITAQAFLYDLLISDRDVIVYKPEFNDGTVASLKLKAFVPSDEEFQRFADKLLSHDAMACVAVTFPDKPGWIDNRETGGELNEETREHLELMTSYAAQLMEAEGLHGFCIATKPWHELPGSNRTTIFVCAVNPFLAPLKERSDIILPQLKKEHRDKFMLKPDLGFHKRLERLAQRTVRDSLPHGYTMSTDRRTWSKVVNSLEDTVHTHNLGFRPTGLLRESHVANLNSKYEKDAQGEGMGEDFSILKINEVMGWLSAWVFMEECGWRP